MATNDGKSLTLTRQERIASEGLRLPVLMLRRLEECGIYCVPRLSVALQKSTQQYMVRAHESGGAVADLGAYCGVVSPDGTPLAWLQRIETIGVNGLHSRALAPALVRIQVLRVQHTYDLLITKHQLESAPSSQRPKLSNTILFRGRQGTLELELWGKDSGFRGRVSPVFFDAGGDPLPLPTQFELAVRSAVGGATCCGCTHSHLLVPSDASSHQATELAAGQPSSEEVSRLFEDKFRSEIQAAARGDGG
jgi:hypothetical protein